MVRYLTKKDLRFPRRENKSHKGNNGRVLIIGGSEQYTGAVTLAGLAALRSGCDLVTVACPEKVAWTVNRLTPELMTVKLKGTYLSDVHYRRLIPSIDAADVILLGNGAGVHRSTQKLFDRILKHHRKLYVLDADALKIVDPLLVSSSILTPHTKELELFLGTLLKERGISRMLRRTIQKETHTKKNFIEKIIKNNDSEQRGGELQRLLDGLLNTNVLVLKGSIDTIMNHEQIFFNKTGNAGMTKGGTGDVLAGLCAGFLAQNKDLLMSAKLGCYMNGTIGDSLLKKKKGYSYIASDMIDHIALVLKRLRR